MDQALQALNPSPSARPMSSRGDVEKGSVSAVAPRAFQAAFFRRMGFAQQFRLLFDALPEVHFFAKDCASRFVAASPEVVRRLGAKSEEDLLGRRDFDFLPPQLSASIAADDASVMATGRPIFNRLETWFDHSRVLDWFVTTKFPIRDEHGEIIGVMGFVRPYEGKDGRRQIWSAGAGISRAVEYIRTHLAEPLGLDELATQAALSKRQLNRKFIEAFGMPPREFIQRTRIQAACELLAQGTQSLAEIATECGFYDQSAFTRYFRRHVGHTPAAYQRQQNGGSRADSAQTLTQRTKIPPAKAGILRRVKKFPTVSK